MVNWTTFECLPGGQEENFEILCRSIIWTKFGRHGQFRSLANQPGVEFHIHLTSDCTLGAPGRWYGWQCRWYDLRPGKSIGTTRRNKILDALSKTSRALPHLTDWVLWTRHTLCKGDQEWFYSLRTGMNLHLWTSSNVEALLSGEAELLRRTYFGDLILTPSELDSLHELSVARIRPRWMPEVHQKIDVERSLRRMLGEPASWKRIAILAKRLRHAAQIIRKTPAAFEGELSILTQGFLSATRGTVEFLDDIYELLQTGSPDLLRERLETSPPSVAPDMSIAARRLRTAKIKAAPYAENALADMRLAQKLVNELRNALGVMWVAVLADAGGGKTQLAAQLTAKLKDRPAGILLHGQDLHIGMTLNDLARKVVIQGTPVASIEALLSALDAAGQRARRRLPLVVDGLNEAEDPRLWKPLIATVGVLLRGFPNVILVCTLRTGARRVLERYGHFVTAAESVARMDFAAQSLPDDIPRLEIPDFGEDAVLAIRKYFDFYRINATDADLPLELLRHPLTLRFFCEVANPERKKVVGVEAMPSSLTGMFDRFLARAAERIAELSPATHRYCASDVHDALYEMGMSLWSQRKRELPEQSFRRTIGDEGRPWSSSIIHMLEQEGVILRIPGEVPGNQHITAVYDALSGHLIADSLLKHSGRAGLETLLRDPATLEALNGNEEKCHPLSSDVFRGLAGLVPRHSSLPRRQLWQFLEAPHLGSALQMTASLEGRYLDSDTVSALADLLRAGEYTTRRLLRRLYSTRSSVEHALNADFLDSVFRTMSCATRDLFWTEWVRENAKWLLQDLRRLEDSWREHSGARTSVDKLRSKWVLWLLTSTVRKLRDHATRALYWFGRGEPAALFSLTESVIDINDPYVSERTLAASYGVAMAIHADPSYTELHRSELRDHARHIFEVLFTRETTHHTTHELIRDYAQSICELAVIHDSSLFSTDELSRLRSPSDDRESAQWQELHTDERIKWSDSPMRPDFENYILGPLAENRNNYDFGHAGFRKIRGLFLWRVQFRGWTAEQFHIVDQIIESEQRHYGRIVNPYEKIDRYGKKYSWISYFELRGLLRDQGLLTHYGGFRRTRMTDIDPSFPDPTPEIQLIHTNVLGSPKQSLRNWIEKAATPPLAEYLLLPAVHNQAGPWVMLDGFVVRQDESLSRRLFAFVRSFLVPKATLREFEAFLKGQSLEGRWLPEKPESYSTFAGEIPWSTTFPDSEVVELEFVSSERKVKRARRLPFFYFGNKLVKLSPSDQLAPSMSVNQDVIDGWTLTDEQLKRVVRRTRMVEVEEIQREFRSFEVLIPVYDFSWEGRNVDNKSVTGVTLAKQLALASGLTQLHQTHDLRTRDGKRATLGTGFHSDYNNSERFFFIGEQILREMLRENDLSLVWAIWGEREISHKQMDRARPGGDLHGFSRKTFQSVHHF